MRSRKVHTRWEKRNEKVISEEDYRGEWLSTGDSKKRVLAAAESQGDALMWCLSTKDNTKEGKATNNASLADPGGGLKGGRNQGGKNFLTSWTSTLTKNYFKSALNNEYYEKIE